MSSPKFTISHKAYTKLIIHAAKYPHAPVNGVLIGTASPAASGSIVVADAIPLLHQWTNLSPMMEIGLDLVSGSRKNIILLMNVLLPEKRRRVAMQSRWACLS